MNIGKLTLDPIQLHENISKLRHSLKVSTDSFFFSEILIINSMIGKCCMTCIKMVARYEDGKILCLSHGFIRHPDFCEDHVAREEILVREPKGGIKTPIGYLPTFQ